MSLAMFLDLAVHGVAGAARSRHASRVVARSTSSRVPERRQGIPELVGQRGDELVLATVGEPEALGAPAQRLLHLLALGHGQVGLDRDREAARACATTIRLSTTSGRRSAWRWISSPVQRPSASRAACTTSAPGRVSRTSKTLRPMRLLFGVAVHLLRALFQ